MGSAISRTQRPAAANPDNLALYLRAAGGVAAAAVLTFFACQIFYAPKMSLPLKTGLIVAIAVIGIAGIIALLAPDDEAPPAEKLYTADEVAQLLAAVQAGQLVPALATTCKFCGGADPDATGVDGARYHRRCFRTAFENGKT
jgi:hypothetical protein